MHYVISDIHGCCREFEALLEQIHFSEKDLLYVIGDVVDRGPDSVGVLKIMALHDNIIPILGNHDFLFEKVAPGLFTEITEDSIGKVLSEDFLGAYDAYQKNGGESTLSEFKTLDSEDREFYMDYIADFPLYETLKVNGKNYFLIHSLPDGYAGGRTGMKAGMEDSMNAGERAGMNAGERAGMNAGNNTEGNSVSALNHNYESDIASFTVEECIFGRPDFFGDWSQETIFIIGHTPTVKLGPGYAGKIYHKENFYDIDCGCVTGHRLGALCLETGEEFYVNSLSQYWSGKKMHR